MFFLLQGAISYWRDSSSMYRIDNIRLPNEMGLYNARWSLICGCNYSISVWSHRNVFPWTNNDTDLFVLWCVAVFNLFDIRYSNDDGWKAQIFNQSRRVYLRCVDFVLGHHKYFYSHFVNYWLFQELKFRTEKLI